jgi:hypothetical protein
MENVQWELTAKQLVLRCDLTQEFGLSRSGKTIIVANSHGGWHFKGTDLSLGLVAYKYPETKTLKPKKQRAMQNIQLRVEDDTAILTIDTTKDFGLSSTGKTKIVASSRGNYHIEGTTIYIGVNVYRKVKKPAPVSPPKDDAKAKAEPTPKPSTPTPEKTKTPPNKVPAPPKEASPPPEASAPAVKKSDRPTDPSPGKEATPQGQKELSLHDIPGIGPAKIKLLKQGKISTLEDLLTCDPAEVASKVPGLGVKTLKKWITEAKTLIAN